MKRDDWIRGKKAKKKKKVEVDPEADFERKTSYDEGLEDLIARAEELAQQQQRRRRNSRRPR